MPAMPGKITEEHIRLAADRVYLSASIPVLVARQAGASWWRKLALRMAISVLREEARR